MPDVITWSFAHNGKEVTNTCHSDTFLTCAYLYSYWDDMSFYE